MNHHRLHLAFLLLVPLALGSCDDHLYGTSGGECTTNPPLTWENFGFGFLDDQCNGCHSHFHEGDDRSGAPVGVDFDSWDLTLQWAERIHIRSVESQTMPPASVMNPSDRVMLDEWMRCEVFPAAGVQ